MDVRRMLSGAVLAMTAVVGVAAVGTGVAVGQQGCASGRVCLYDGTGYSGLLASFSSSAAYVGNSANDRASSAFNATSSGVRLFSDADYRGASVCLGPNAGFSDLGSAGLSNTTSSLRFENC